MTSSNSSSGMAFSDSGETSSDLISNMPSLVIDKILKQLPLRTAAKMSILSRNWRGNWLSCSYVTFDHAFWRKFRTDGVYDWQRGSSIISNILFHHNGPIHNFFLELRPFGVVVEKNSSLSQWLSLLSRTCPKKITLINRVAEWSDIVCMPTYIFHCSELTKLKLYCFILYAPPFDFKGFPYLRTLELFHMRLKRNVLQSLLAKCPFLVCLRIEHCSRMHLRDVDAPRLEKLTLKGQLGSLSLKNCPRLVDVSLWSTESKLKGTQKVVATIKSLATSHELQRLAIEGSLCKFLAAGRINKSLPLPFNHLNRLCLMELKLSDRGVFCFTIGMIQSCLFIKELEISVSRYTSVLHHMNEYNSGNYKLGMLDEVKIMGITGSTGELKVIEYVLAVSVVLKKFFFECAAVQDISEVTRELMRFPKASPTAHIICLNK